VTEPAPVVLIDGDDPTLVADAVAKQVDELAAGLDRSLAVEDHGGGEEVDLAAVVDACATLPFLVDRRIVVVRDVGRFTADDLAPVLHYLEDPSPFTTLILAAGGGQTSQKLVNAVKAQGQVTSTRVDTRQAGQWLKDRARQSAVQLDAAALAVVSDRLGEDVGRAVPLLDLLAAVYGEGARLGPDDVEPYIGAAGAVTPWAFTDAIDAGQTETALGMLHRLLEGGERHPLVVLAILHRHVQSLMRVDGDNIVSEAQAAEAMRIPKGRSTFPAKKALASARRWGSAGIADAISLVADAELALKGASSWPPEAVLEVLVARLCRLARAPVGGRAVRS
jgi:DNA polymerase-3 subunit delta